MSTSTPEVNPYPTDKAEHILWERLHQGFFTEPIHAQLHSIEADSGLAFSTLMETIDQIPLPTVQVTVRSELLKIEAASLLLDESAEHAFQRVVSKPAVPGEEGASGAVSEDGLNASK